MLFFFAGTKFDSELCESIASYDPISSIVSCVSRRVFEDSCVYAAYIVHYSGPALSDRGNIEKNRGKNGAHPFCCCTSDPLCVQRSTFVQKNSVVDSRDREKKRKRVKVRK